MTQHVDRIWLSFRDKVVPADAGHHQVADMKRAFYAGALSLLNAMMRDLDPGEGVTTADERRMAEIAAELEAFGRTGGRL